MSGADLPYQGSNEHSAHDGPEKWVPAAIAEQEAHIARQEYEGRHLTPVTSFKAVVSEPQGQHCRVRLFAGVDEGHRALVGTMVMRVNEARDFEVMCQRWNVVETEDGMP